jgi:hypothetical protein
MKIKNIDKLRLTKEEIESIKKIVINYDSKAKVFIFGSRTDLFQKAEILIFW